MILIEKILMNKFAIKKILMKKNLMKQIKYNIVEYNSDFKPFIEYLYNLHNSLHNSYNKVNFSTYKKN